jgi:hypothetical protein
MRALATALPAEPRRAASRPRPVEIASTKAQRKARPRAVYALVTVAGLLLILLAQLLLSIVVSDGAYRISSLQDEQKELARDSQVISEEIQVLRSPQHLAASAVSLGMVGGSSMAYLRLADGAVLGSPSAAKASDTIRFGEDGAPLIANELLDGIPVVSVAAGATTADGTGEATPGAPGMIAPADSVASTPQALPAPNTR